VRSYGRSRLLPSIADWHRNEPFDLGVRPHVRSRQLRASVAIYIGTDTRARQGTGDLSHVPEPDDGRTLAAAARCRDVNPTFLALHPSHKFLFAASNVSLPNHPAEGAATAFAIDPSTGKLTMINQQPSGGPGPCHVSIAPDGRHLVLGNYTGAALRSFLSMPMGSSPSRAGVIQDDNSDPARRPHGHCSQFDPTGKFVVAMTLAWTRSSCSASTRAAAC